MENVVLDVTDLNTGVLCSWAVLEERLKPGGNSKESWVLDGIISQNPGGSHIFDVFFRLCPSGKVSKS